MSSSNINVNVVGLVPLFSEPNSVNAILVKQALFEFQLLKKSDLSSSPVHIASTVFEEIFRAMRKIPAIQIN